MGQKPKADKETPSDSPVRCRLNKRRRRILVVDDEKSIQDVLTGILSMMGYDVVSAASGHEGLNLFLKNPIELVLTDLNMPGMDGWTLASHIKKQSPDTPVVLITGSEKEVVHEKLERGCVDSVLFKPFILEDFQKTVQGMVDLANHRSATHLTFPRKHEPGMI